MSTYDEVSTTTRKAIITKAVNAASELLAVGRTDLAVEILFAPRVVRAANHLLKDGHQVSLSDVMTEGKVVDLEPRRVGSVDTSRLLGDTQERRWKGDEVTVIENPWRSHLRMADYGHVHDQFGRCWKRRAAPMPCEPERNRLLHAYDALDNCSACGHAHVGPASLRFSQDCDPSGWPR